MTGAYRIGLGPLAGGRLRRGPLLRATSEPEDGPTSSYESGHGRVMKGSDEYHVAYTVDSSGRADWVDPITNEPKSAMGATTANVLALITRQLGN